MKQLDNILANIKENQIKLVLFAEVHGLINETGIQKDIIEALRPDIFLYELLEEEKCITLMGYDNILSKQDNEDFSFISTYADLKPTIQLAKEFSIPIIGCDIKNMLRERKMDWENETLDPNKEDIILLRRELQQNKIIQENQNNKTLIVSIGAYHFRENSDTLEGLNDYAIIYPTDINTGEFPIEFSKGKEYEYKVKINKGIKI